MRNKRGFVFPLYIVALTLLMSGTVIMLYLNHQEGLNSSLVSPLVVLDARDDLEVFEMRERELIGNSLEEWDVDVLRVKLVAGLTEEMRDFIFSNLVWDGNLMDGGFSEDSFLENVLYKEIYEESGNLVLKRAKIGKKILLSSEDAVKVSFPVEFEFEFEREYLISRNGKVEVVI